MAFTFTFTNNDLTPSILLANDDYAVTIRADILSLSRKISKGNIALEEKQTECEN